ncbi:hypothetical protein ABZY36_07860 [Streptomyces sp. NPDC006627]|uniref:hypothetical protein n=1 Tax=Streptomyces sp. NPDC006627 TaxID=3154679 RepID=UPI0033A2ADE4
MSQRMNRRVMLAVGVVMACLPVSTVHAAGAEPTPPGLEKREVDVPVVNGSFSQPKIEVPQGTEAQKQVKGKPPWYWGRGNAEGDAGAAAGVIVPAGDYRAHREDGGQAVQVNALRDEQDKKPDTEKQLKTRLWDVRRGSLVKLQFEYSPTTDLRPEGGCESTQQKEEAEQRKPINLHVDTGTSDSRMPREKVWEGRVAAPKPHRTGVVGEADWQKVTEYFTAKVDNPEVAFSLSDVTYGKDDKSQKPVAEACHPMIAAVSASQRPIEVDKSSRKSDLPPATSFTGNEPSKSETKDKKTVPDPTRALQECATSTNDCKFTLNQRYSYGYYDRPRPIGEVYENCTFSESQASAALRDKRKVVYRERSFDSATQSNHTQFLDSSSHDGLTDEDLRHDVANAAPSKQGKTPDDKLTNAGKAAVHFAAAYEKVRDQPWQWSRTVERDIDVVTPKNHASWVEVSAARERADGHYTVTVPGSDDTKEPTVHRQFITYDGPSRITSDRVFQRHGTLSPTEIARCKTHRPLPYTPATEPVVPYDPKDRDVKDESLTPGTAVSKRNMPPATK